MLHAVAVGLLLASVAFSASPSAPSLVSAEAMRSWLECAYANNARLIQLVQSLGDSGDVSAVRSALEKQACVYRALEKEGDTLVARAEAEGRPLHERKDLHSMLSEYRLKLEAQDAELNYLICESEPLKKFPGLSLLMQTFSVNVRASDFLHADTQKRLKAYTAKACALAQELAACIDRITDADSAAEMAVKYAQLRRELALCVGIINNYMSGDLEGAQQNGLSRRCQAQMENLSREFEKKLPRLDAVGYYGCEPLRAMLAPIVGRTR